MLYSLENWMWFRGLTQGKQKKGVQLSIFPRKSAVVLWFQAREHTTGVQICSVPSKNGCGFVVSAKWRRRRTFILICSLENMLWFCGFTQVKTKKGLQFVILPENWMWFCGLTQGKEKEGVQFDIFSRKSAVVLWFHPGED